ncbi:EFR1 family ferrodoxin [Candidatus Contubernalis alkaliaceticus]|uniref:EFR1 family ferrodoxin n=1 Tax=Candidatus Contubernalis alkaliaceticus TaxID=338645 RepID=UPI001F4BFF12|nr:EFR1 family ferrodoxin [Candidatus Contubernalis alkalaceticus]UNC91087.1 hypothetical protein HUE98_02695 [Candidatus Contubernalis alkalaceticus]
MKKASIFYFSGTGNTWWVSETFVRIFNEKGITASAYSVEKINGSRAGRIISESDLVGFGFPTHGSDLPFIMKEFFQELPPVKNKRTFIFCTQWMWSGDGARVAEEFLDEKQFNIFWAEHFFMPSNVCVSVTRFLPYTNDRMKISKTLAKTEKRIRGFIHKIMNERPFRRGFNRISEASGAFQRVPFRRFFERLRDDIFYEKSLCIRCRKCARLCPSGNLIFEGKELKTKGICILCLRCYSFCPVSAITYMNKPHNLKRGEPYKGPVKEFNPELLLADDSD